MIIFRDDDINYNTNFYKLYYLYQLISEVFPSSEIWACVTLFSRQNGRGSVYDEIPFKNKPVPWFYDVDRILERFHILHKVKICSHGLFHVDHSKLHKEAQEMSIISSCRFLKTSVFVPPFNRFNDDTISVCRENGIELIQKDGWRNFEYADFDPSHPKWYFHSWRWETAELWKILTAGRETERPDLEKVIATASGLISEKI